MKRQYHKVTKAPNSRAIVESAWTNQMREAVHVHLTAEKTPEKGALVLYDAEEADVFHTFSGLAEIAWEMGWRPKGLGEFLGVVIKEFKLAPTK